MSTIYNLIARLCPNGVAFKPLKELVIENKGGGTPSRSNKLFWGGSIPWASVGDLTNSKLGMTTTRSSITDEGLEKSSTNIIPAGDLLIATKIAPGVARVAEVDIAINQDIRGLRLVDSLEPYFVAYFFKTLNIVGNGTIVKGITSANLLRIRIPVPPLEVQREIVKILDTFSALEAELEAELGARRKQFEFYRDSLLDFDDLSLERERERDRWFTMSELTKIRNGKDHKHLSSGEVPVYGSGGIMRYVDTVASYGPSVLIPRKGTLGNLFYVDGPFWNVDTIFSTEINVSLIEPKFLFYQLLTLKLGDMNQAGGVPSQTQRVLNKISIAVPPLEEQRRIVEVLDKFDALVNDISVGLPAEIKARRQQYEYYRDQLLTFKELEVPA